MIHSRANGTNDLMQVAVVLPRADVSHCESRLIAALSRLPQIDHLSVLTVAGDRSLAARMERLRAGVERRIARERWPASRFESDRDLTVEEVQRQQLWPRIESIGAGVVIVLTASVPPPATRARVLELRFDGVQPEGLGVRRAGGAPPREVTIVSREEKGLRVVQRSMLTPTRGIESSDRRNAAARAIALFVRVVQDENVDGEASHHADASLRAWTRSTRAASAITATIGSAVLRKTANLLFAPEWWHLAYRTSREHFVANAPSLTPQGFREIDCGADRFQADPIAISFDGIDAVFFEEYVYGEGRGVISCATLDEHGNLNAPRRVLERPYHLSYPFVFVHEGVVFMIPETFANETIELYRCTRFPYEWTFEKTLLAGLTATDATLHHDGTRWWMFVTVGENGAYTWDELHLFLADSPFGPWRPHPRNPVKCDAASARPAGPLFRRHGKLIRPAQDCSRTYGGAIHLCEIEVLTPDDYRERVVDRIAPDWFRNADGLHTLTATDRIEVIDVRTPRRFRWTPLT